MRKLISILLLSPFAAMAQQNTSVDGTAYPQDYFRNPLDIPIFLAGNFGECRPGHFHSGMDIKTLGKEGQPVHAAADGYISRIKMEKGGFGHAIYITHANGYTTLYAHLSDFMPAIQKYVRREQYNRKRWDVDLQLSPSDFPVKKGQQIAWSGNTGGSTAPHLHFEIRNTKTEHPLNAELFGLPVIDQKAPVVKEVAFYGIAADNSKAPSIYEDGMCTAGLEQKGGIYKPAKAGNGTDYKVNNDTISIASGHIGIGINVDDYMEGSDNTLAFYTAKLFMDDSLQAQITMDDIGYDQSRYVNAYADYKTKELQHKWEQCLFQLPGNLLDGIYSHLNAEKGRINLEDGQVHKITIVITDDKGNESNVRFYLTGRKTTSAVAAMPAGFTATPFYVNKPASYSDPNVMFSLKGKELYDNIVFMSRSEPYSKGYSDKYQLHYPYVPVHRYFDLQIKPGKPVPFDLRSKMVMMYSDGKDDDGRAAVAVEQGWYKASVRDFGTYWLDIDTIPPVIKSLQKSGSNLAKAKQITFEVKDQATSVKSFSGYLDDKWICFEQHGDLFFYKFDEHCPKGKHELVFKAEDENGNTRSYTLTFTR